MTRKKVKLAYIINDNERRASFKKRKKGLIKKVSELSTLCGVDACAIIYSPFDAEPEVWPSVEGAHAVLERFASMSIVDRTRKMVDQESLTRHRIKKANDLLHRLQRENKCRQLQRILFNYIDHNGCTSDPFYLSDAPDWVFAINQTLGNIKELIETRKKNRGKATQLQAVAAPLPPPPPPVAAPVAAPPPEMSFWFPGEQEEEPPLMSMEELEGYPWDLVQSPVVSKLDDGWDDESLMKLNFFFDNNNNGDGAGPSGTKPGDDDGGNKTLDGLDDGWDDENLMKLNFFFDNNNNGDGAGPSGTKPGDGDGDGGNNIF